MKKMIIVGLMSEIRGEGSGFGWAIGVELCVSMHRLFHHLDFCRENNTKS